MESNEEDKLCEAYGRKLILCPFCKGTDPYVGKGKTGYYICHNKKCKEYKYCCDC